MTTNVIIRILIFVVTSAQVVKTVNVISNIPSRNYTHPDGNNLTNLGMILGFKAFTVLNCCLHVFNKSFNKKQEVVPFCSVIINPYGISRNYRYCYG